MELPLRGRMECEGGWEETPDTLRENEREREKKRERERE